MSEKFNPGELGTLAYVIPGLAAGTVSVQELEHSVFTTYYVTYGSKIGTLQDKISALKQAQSNLNAASSEGAHVPAPNLADAIHQQQTQLDTLTAEQSHYSHLNGIETWSIGIGAGIAVGGVALYAQYRLFRRRQERKAQKLQLLKSYTFSGN